MTRVMGAASWIGVYLVLVMAVDAPVAYMLSLEEGGNE